jgi:hypothetical protein
VYDVARKNAEIRAQNKRNKWEIPMLNERAGREAEEARRYKSAREKEEHNYFKKKHAIAPLTQDEGEEREESEDDLEAEEIKKVAKKEPSNENLRIEIIKLK